MATRVTDTFGRQDQDEEIDNLYRAIATLNKKLSSLSTTTVTQTAPQPVPQVLSQDDIPALSFDKWRMEPSMNVQPNFVALSKWEAG